ncbi:ABC transporter substrate-binding protein [Paenibacillus sediminis]|uniref:Polar amino acid transport system substrate-binding protein n=1 Tax=Paenibacillus sediminis TaxID=664909 RepID=A0ABS4H0A2_9BACL|nr:ABC transporter substrate-binding protein [Paenibacillus sediminis]MBP1935954.1 polar amino acid transport system substrate-binding protein [Paenibacillus sediminis]
MKKWVTLTLCLLLVSSVLAACGQKEDTYNTVQKTKKIVLGTSADYPPYEFHMKVNGKDQIVGFDIEIAKEIAKDMGAQLEIKDTSFDVLLNELNSGKVDMVISGMNPTPERKKAVDFTTTYYKAEQAVLVRKGDEAKYDTMDKLEGKKIGVQKTSVQEGIAKDIKNAKLTSLSKISDLILELESGRVDALILELPVAKSYVANRDTVAIAGANPKWEDDGYAIAVRKGSPKFAEAINKTLERLKSENKIDQFVTDANQLVGAK